jgi:putative hemolysin
VNTPAVSAALVLIALLTAGSTAVRAVSRIWLRHWVERRLAGAGLAEHFLDRPQRLVVAAGSGVALAAFAAGAAVAGGDAWAVVVRVLAVSVVALLAAQVVPRAVARRWPTRVAPALLPLLRAADAALAPARFVGARLAAPAHERLTRVRSAAEVARSDIESCCATASWRA